MATKCFDTDAFNAIVARIQAGFTELVTFVSNPTLPTDGSTASGPWKMNGQADLWISRGDKPSTIPGDVTAVNGSATINATSGKVTSESLVTVPGANYTLTLNNDKVFVGDTVTATVVNGTNSTGTPVLESSVVSDAKTVITVRNGHSTESFNGTVIISFTVNAPTATRRR